MLRSLGLDDALKAIDVACRISQLWVQGMLPPELRCWLAPLCFATGQGAWLRPGSMPLLQLKLQWHITRVVSQAIVHAPGI